MTDPTHDEDVRLVRDRMCQMCTGEDETAYSENCRRPKGAHDCWLQDALDRILSRYDALVAEPSIAHIVARVGIDLDTLRDHFKPVVDTDYDADPGVVTEAEMSGILVATLTLFGAWRGAQASLPGYASLSPTTTSSE